MRLRKGSREARAWGRRMARMRKRKNPTPRKRKGHLRRAARRKSHQIMKIAAHPLKAYRRHRRGIRHSFRKLSRQNIPLGELGVLALVTSVGIAKLGFSFKSNPAGTVPPTQPSTPVTPPATTTPGIPASPSDAQNQFNTATVLYWDDLVASYPGGSSVVSVAAAQMNTWVNQVTASNVNSMISQAISYLQGLILQAVPGTTPPVTIPPTTGGTTGILGPTTPTPVTPTPTTAPMMQLVAQAGGAGNTQAIAGTNQGVWQILQNQPGLFEAILLTGNPNLAPTGWTATNNSGNGYAIIGTNGQPFLAFDITFTYTG